MWVKRSEWERMKNTVENLDRLRAGTYYDIERAVISLKFLHGMPIMSGEDLPFLTAKSPEEYHQTVSKGYRCQTDAIPDLTLEELARFVIDGTPIKRKQEVDVEFRGE